MVHYDHVSDEKLNAPRGPTVRRCDVVLRGRGDRRRADSEKALDVWITCRTK